VEKLDCGHSFCSVCLLAYFEGLINAHRVSEEDLFCPAPKCLRPISENQVKRNLSNELYDKLCRFRRAKIFEDPKSLDPSEVAVFCLQCGEVAIMGRKEQRYTHNYDYECVYCHYRFCP